jgi:RNA polymerase II-associated factor 1
MADKGFKQDLVVSTRYQNRLPPPPFAPKFLEIDTGGLDQYLTTSFASSLARREEPNIDVDAEGGMPIDMIGVPGYLAGDESAIMAPEQPPMLEAEDQELLLSVDQIKKQSAANNVSFLRKTQYLSTSNSRAADPFTKKAPVRRLSNAAPAAAIDRDDPENVKRHVQKGFDLAYPDSVAYNDPSVKGLPRSQQERNAWNQPVHPSGNTDLKVVDVYPLIPDFEANTDEGGAFQRIRFDKPPLMANHGKRDDRIDVATFQTLPNEELSRDWNARMAAFEADPTAYEHPGPEPHTYVMAAPTEPSQVPLVRKFLYDGHPDKDDPEVYSSMLAESISGDKRVPFERKRVYKSNVRNPLDPRRVFAVGLYDPLSTKNQVPPSEAKMRQGKCAYYYPIQESIRLRSDRSKIAHPSLPESDTPMADLFMYLPRELDAREAFDRVLNRGINDDQFGEEYEALRATALAQQEAEQAEDVVETQGMSAAGQVGDDEDQVRNGEDVALDQNGGTRPAGDDDDDAMEDD